VPNGKNLDQGRSGGANRKGKEGNHLDEARSGGARTKPSGSHLDQNPNNRSKPSSQDHLNPPRESVAGRKTAERGGHNRVGHDRVNPTAGKSKSGNHLDPHPSLKKR